MTGFARPPLPRVKWYTDDNERDATFTTQAPRMPWDTFTRTIFHPRPGEHITGIGSTGRGKSNLMNHIYPLFPYVAVFGTKRTDSTMDRLKEQQGFVVFEKWRSLPAGQYPRRIIWPQTAKLANMTDVQQEVFTNAIEHIYAEGGRPKEAPVGWAIGIDELWYLVHMLKMEKLLKLILQHARSSGITLIGATQRAAFIPTEFFSMPTHLFFFKTTDENNLQRVGDLQAGNKALIRTLVSHLEEFQVLYVNNVTGQMARTRTPVPKG